MLAFFLYLKNRKQINHNGIPGEPSEFSNAASEICARGFDCVLLGHTHHAGHVKNDQFSYINTGSFMLDPHYALIQHGEVSLKKWQKGKMLGD